MLKMDLLTHSHTSCVKIAERIPDTRIPEHAKPMTASFTGRDGYGRKGVVCHIKKEALPVVILTRLLVSPFLSNVPIVS